MKRIIPFLLVLPAVFFLSCRSWTDTVILVSANAEWKALVKVITPGDDKMNSSPYGKWFTWTINNRKVIFFHGGWGKIDASGSTQYVIDRFDPELLINIGTAGGFPGRVSKGDIILVNKAVTYDIYEKMGDSREALEYYSSDLEYPQLEKRDDIKISSIVSADQDLFPEKIPGLSKEYGACAGDWESSSIAHVAKKNGVKCYIIRGITDVVYPSGSETYGDFSAFERSTESVIKKLYGVLDKIL